MTATSIARPTADSERKFYSRMAIAMALIVFIGFAPSFYSFQTISFPRPNPPLTPLTILHGLVFTAWMIMIVAQTQLVSANRRDLHMKLGVWGFGLAASMVPLIYFTGVHSVPRGIHPPFATGEQWAALPLIDLPTFAWIVYMGWKHRRDPQAHKRLMILAAGRMLEPAFGRMPLGPPVSATIYLDSLLALSISFIPLIWWDMRQLGKLHWVTKTVFVVFVATFATRYLVWTTQGWHDFVHMLPG